MGCEQVKVSHGLNAGFSLGGIAHHMVKDTAEIVDPCLIPLPIHLGLSQNSAVRCQDLPPDDPVRKTVQAGIVRVIDHILAPDLEKIPQIHGQSQEHGHHEISDPQNVFISPWIGICFFCHGSISFL